MYNAWHDPFMILPKSVECPWQSRPGCMGQQHDQGAIRHHLRANCGAVLQAETWPYNWQGNRETATKVMKGDVTDVTDVHRLRV